jgi:type IV fimbrial biogenesis protein FimT
MLKKSLRASGFSLIELIITVTIVGILSAIAIPSFSNIISNNRLTAYSNEFVGALNLARSEAIKRGTQVTVERLGGASETKNWHWGWQVFVDIADQPPGNKLFEFKDNNNAQRCEIDSNGAAIEDCVLRTYTKAVADPYNLTKSEQFLPNNFTLISHANSADAIGFNSTGKNVVKSSGLANTTLILCDTNRSTPDNLESAKVIILNNTGRIRLGIDSDSNGIPENGINKNISSCTP